MTLLVAETKTMTATLVLQLVQRGRLHLQDSVSEFIRGVPFAPAAHGYLGRPTGGARDVTDWNQSWIWTAGAASSTLGDLRRWAPAVATGRGLLSKRMQRKRLPSTRPSRS